MNTTIYMQSHVMSILDTLAYIALARSTGLDLNSSEGVILHGLETCIDRVADRPRDLGLGAQS